MTTPARYCRRAQQACSSPKPNSPAECQRAQPVSGSRSSPAIGPERPAHISYPRPSPLRLARRHRTGHTRRVAGRGGVSSGARRAVPTAAQAEELGGKVIVAPMTLDDSIVVAYLTDPNGSLFALFRPEQES
jgi:hypothetical protein